MMCWISAHLYKYRHLMRRSYQLPVPPTPGVYFGGCALRDPAGNWSAWQTYRTVNVLLGIPDKPQLISPGNKSKLDDNTPDLEWNPVDFGVNYEVQVDNNADFGSPEQEVALPPGTLQDTADPLLSGKYFWRARAVNANGEKGAWSATWYFIIN